MTTVTVSSQYRVDFPKEIREKLRIEIGQKIVFFSYENRLQLIPFRELSEMRGFLKETDTTNETRD